MGRWRCDARGKRFEDVSRSVAYAQPCQHLCRLIDVAFTHHRQDATESVHFDFGVLESALEVIGPSLALCNVVGAFEFAFGTVRARGPGAGASCFSMLTARAGTSYLEGIAALGRFSLAFGQLGCAATAFQFGFIVIIPDAVETVVAAASTGSLARASGFLASAS